MSVDLISLAIVPAVIFLAATVVGYSRLPRSVKALVVAGLALRVVGAVVRYLVLTRYYHGVGNAIDYYNVGLGYADLIRDFHIAPLLDPIAWRGGTWTGTQFVYFPSGLVLSIIGPSFLGEFVAFSLLAFCGLAAFVIAFHRAYPEVPISRYAQWVWLFPSLWFWPSRCGEGSSHHAGFRPGHDGIHR